MRILISGTASGLGAALHKRFGGEAYNRTSPLAPSGGFDMIVHCAVDTAKTVTHDSIESYFRNNVELTRRLLALRHRRFVFISSVDVYPKSLPLCSEDAAINAHDISGVYGISKFYSEALVKESGAAPLILRASALLGPSMRENSLTRMLKAPGTTLGLSAASTFNYVRYDDIGDLVEAANREGVQGIVNSCSAAPVALQQVADEFGCDVTFGNFRYATPPLSNERAAALVPGLTRSSLETVKLFREAQNASVVSRPAALRRSI